MEINESKLRDGIYLDVEQAVQGLKESLEVIHANQANRSLAEESLKMTGVNKTVYVDPYYIILIHIKNPPPADKNQWTAGFFIGVCIISRLESPFSVKKTHGFTKRVPAASEVVDFILFVGIPDSNADGDF